MNIEEINRNARYIVTDNCIIQKEESEDKKKKTKVKYIIGKDIVKTYGTDCEIDRRLNLLILNSTGDLKEYLQYYFLVVGQINTEVQSVTISGKFVAQLDMGYLPIFMAPTHLYNDFNERFRSALNKHNISFLEKTAMRIDGTYVNSHVTDFWISRVEVGKMLGKHPCSVKAMDVLTILAPDLGGN